MQFKVGDIVHNKSTKEEGRIVRIADLPGYGFCYIVSVTPNETWGTTPKEVIWGPSEVST
jgi:GTP-binding protein EngB required for normal cell division